MAGAGGTAGLVYELEPGLDPARQSDRPEPRLSRRPPPHATIGKDVHCGACWYNLRGLAFIGRCPECGTRYNAWKNARGQATAESRRRRRYMKTITNVPIVAGGLSWQAFGVFVMLVGATGAAALVGWIAHRLIFR